MMLTIPAQQRTYLVGQFQAIWACSNMRLLSLSQQPLSPPPGVCCERFGERLHGKRRPSSCVMLASAHRHAALAGNEQVEVCASAW